MKVAIQGIEGSFSEEAARAWLATHGRLAGVELVYAVTEDETFRQVAEGEAELGVAALFNHAGGPVVKTIESMGRYPFRVVGNHAFLITQNLLVQNGTDLPEIEEVHSHPQALAQCKVWLHANLPHAKLIEEEDTATAARDLAAGKYGAGAAVVGSQMAAAMFGLSIRVPAIQTLRDNFTHFVVIGRRES